MSENEERGPAAPPSPVAALSGEQEIARLDDTSIVGHFATIARAIADATVGPLIGKEPTTPTTPHGFYDFVTVDDPGFAEMADYADASPRVTGVGWRPPVGIAVLDLDEYKPHAAQQFATFAAAVELPDTLTVVTGQGGRHLVYRLPDDARRSALSRPKDSGIDAVRTHSQGYLVGPGSVHPDTGELYRFGELRRPIAELPADAATALRARDRIPRRHTTGGEAFIGESDLAAVLCQFPNGEPSVAMLSVIGDPRTYAAALTGSLHPTIHNSVTHAVRLALEGDAGLPSCLMVLGAAFVGELDRRERSGEAIGRSVEHAMREFQSIVVDVLAVEGLVSRCRRHGTACWHALPRPWGSPTHAARSGGFSRRAAAVAGGPEDDDELAQFRRSLGLNDAGDADNRPASAGLLDLESLRAQPLPPREWLETGIFEMDAVNKLTSVSGAGKSILLAHCAVNWSLGRSALDVDESGRSRRLSRPVHVLYIDGELGPRWWHRTLDKLAAPSGLPRFHVVTLTDSAPTWGALSTPIGAAEFVDFVSDLDDELDGLDVVIVDTLSAFVGGEENSNDTWADFDRLVTLPLKRAGFTLVYADHAGHGGERARGGSAKKAKLDVEWVLTVRDPERDPNRLELSSDPTRGKMRNGHDGHPMRVVLDRVDGPLGHRRVAVAVAPSPDTRVRDELLQVFRDNPDGLTKTAAIDLVGGNSTRARAEFDRLVSHGRLVVDAQQYKTKRGQMRSKHIYSLAPTTISLSVNRDKSSNDDEESGK
ncbi:AAA family ATPase [Gordonia sp. HS-NH1]|uniref:AAA family ATPase n=1 Tax=Gordonia sp. HS-NH1 TaxID=1435068 RepID=UPI0006E188FF|nr:AAA family ATPase [Gordonia sp. HS-NH1]